MIMVGIPGSLEKRLQHFILELGLDVQALSPHLCRTTVPWPSLGFRMYTPAIDLGKRPQGQVWGNCKVPLRKRAGVGHPEVQAQGKNYIS
jgi:hypothetical protein